jgi:transcriptional regulator GlxA family with amidase domain
MTSIEVLVLRGAMASSVAITVDVLATANRLHAARGRRPPFRVRLAGAGAKRVQGLWPQVHDEQMGPPEVVIVPGLGMATEAEVTARLKDRDIDQARRRLTAAAAEGVEIATSCSGAFLLAHAGLLDGRRATTSWWLAPIFRRLYPAVRLDTEALVVTDGGVTTAGAALAQMDLMLAIIARRAGAALAEETARYLLLDQRRSQSRYMALGYLAGRDDAVGRAEAWAKDNLGRDFAVAEMAAAVGFTPRTFARRVEKATGLSPVRFVQRIRVERASELLETTRMTLEQIAVQVGYSEPSTLRRLIHRHQGRAPSRLRSPPLQPAPRPRAGSSARAPST